ncbi:MAG: hypothetical protein QW534_09130 [Candidatus Methanomethylicia archaeon]
MVDDTIISVGSMRKIVYVAFEPLLRRILYIWVCDVANILTSLAFLKKIRAIYGSNIIVFSDETQYYKHHVNMNLEHELYCLGIRNLM